MRPPPPRPVQLPSLHQEERSVLIIKGQENSVQIDLVKRIFTFLYNPYLTFLSMYFSYTSAVASLHSYSIKAFGFCHFFGPSVPYERSCAI